MRYYLSCLLMIVCLGCESEVEKTPETSSPPPERKEIIVEAPQRFKSLQKFDGQTIQVKGIYTRGLKKMPKPGKEPEYSQLAIIELPDDGRVSLGIREEAELEKYHNQPVAVTGTLIMGMQELQEDVAQIDLPQVEKKHLGEEKYVRVTAELVKVSKIEIAP